TREEAILMGELMLQQGIIHHVFDEHNFKDEPLFYRFYSDEVESNVSTNSNMEEDEIDSD
ncbi:hypothetical protein, partial [Hydrocoleum sp. CS-953]